MNIITVNIVQIEAAKVKIKASKLLGEKPSKEIIKIANAKNKPDPNLPEDEVQYILESYT